MVFFCTTHFLRSKILVILGYFQHFSQAISLVLWVFWHTTLFGNSLPRRPPPTLFGDCKSLGNTTLFGGIGLQKCRKAHKIENFGQKFSKHPNFVSQASCQILFCIPVRPTRKHFVSWCVPQICFFFFPCNQICIPQKFVCVPVVRATKKILCPFVPRQKIFCIPVHPANTAFPFLCQ